MFKDLWIVIAWNELLLKEKIMFILIICILLFCVYMSVYSLEEWRI